MEDVSTIVDNEYFNLKELDSQIGDFVVNSEIEEMLKIQVEEVEMLQSMFSNPGEFEIFDHGIIADINEFIEGKCSALPSRMDFTINLSIDDKKLEVCVNLPIDYPAEEPDIFVRSNSLSRTQQHKINSELANYVCSLGKGEICIYPAIAWLQEHACSYFVSAEKPNLKSSSFSKMEGKSKFSRCWIYSHHIYSKIKRRCIIDLAQEHNLTGFCLPGRPGIICIEGWDTDCNDMWQKIRCMNWKKIVCKKKEEEQVAEGACIESFRKFIGFEEISFDANKVKSRDYHMDMGEFFKYLTDHNCSYVFRDYFGMDGRSNTSLE